LTEGKTNDVLVDVVAYQRGDFDAAEKVTHVELQVREEQPSDMVAGNGTAVHLDPGLFTFRTRYASRHRLGGHVPVCASKFGQRLERIL